MTKTENIKLFNAALDEDESGVILRGSVDVETIHNLKIDDYQREEQSPAAQKKIMQALVEHKSLPDLDLGMRGSDFMERNGIVYLRDPVFIIDGQQRVSAAHRFMLTHPNEKVRLGAKVHFDTNSQWEKERFHALNLWRIQVSSNILLRNLREENGGVLMLYGLSHNDRSFPLYDRVSWNQNMRRQDLIKARVMLMVVNELHRHKAPGMSSSIERMAETLARSVELIGIQTVRENTKTFFDLIDHSWGIRGIQYRSAATYMKLPFLLAMARMLSKHYNFWTGPDEKKLFIEAPLRRKIKSFGVDDPNVIRLSGSGGKAGAWLETLLTEHINSGKRTRKLRPRRIEVLEEDYEDEYEEEAA